MKIHKSKDEATAAAVDKVVTSLVEKALARGATDVHIEPRSRNIVVRYRIDGWLQEAAKLPLPALDSMMRNLKSRAGLDPAEAKAPQSGNFRFESGQTAANVQLATMPTVTGEKAVLHLSRDLSEPATLETLGFWGKALHTIEMTVAEPHGLIAAADLQPTGGTLSLLGIVHLLNNPALNISTLEEAVEQQIAGVTQTQVHPGLGINFANGLRALLKQDPNVIMVGSLSDRDTVHVAVRASLGGRLILGGLHASDAAHGIQQLLRLHAEPYMVAPALRLGIGQRFVRRLCPMCHEACEPDETARKQLRKLLKGSGITSVSSLHELERTAAESGLGADTSNLSSTEKTITRVFRAHADGCPRCRFSGFSGQVGLHEVLLNSDAMQKLLVSNPSTSAIHAQAVRDGMIPLALDGVIKALRGLTTLEEVVPLAA